MTLNPAQQLKDAEGGFLDRVDEISRLVEGLKDGTLPVDYVDEREKEINAREEEKGAQKRAQAQEAERNKWENLPPARQEELTRKARELQRRYKWKQTARAKFETYRQVHGTEYRGTDYTAWDMWTPSDEEDELINNMTPDSPEFKAMEKDIDERHAMLVRKRQVAERNRVGGNDAFKAQQFAEALQYYEAGLAAEKHNVPLHLNAAMASLRMGCPVGAIEHCDKALHIVEFLHENRRDYTASRMKALHRRATARFVLKHFKEALADLALAEGLEAGDADVAKLRRKVELAKEEEERGKQLARKVSEEGGEGGGGKMETLKHLEKLGKGLWGLVGIARAEAGGTAASKSAESLPAICRAVEKILADHDDYRAFARECGVVKHLAHLVDKGREAHDLSPVLGALNAAALNDGNVAYLTAQKAFFRAVVGAVGEGGNAAASGAAVQLLQTCSTEDDARKSIALQVAKRPEAAARLFQMLHRDTPVVTLRASLLLLGNLATEAKFRNQMLDAAASEPIQAVVGLLEYDVLDLVERASAILGNICANPELRRRLVGHDGGIEAVLKGVAREAEKSFGKLGAGSEASEATLRNLLTALANCLVEAEAQQKVVARKGLRHLLQVLRTTKDRTTAVRTLSCLGRLSKLGPAAEELSAKPNLAKVLQVLEGALAAEADTTAHELVENCSRILAACLTRSASAVEEVVAQRRVGTLVRVLQLPGATDGSIGNTALCVAELPKAQDGLTAVADLDPVPALLEAVKTRQGAAQKNSAIAIAKLAPSPQCMAKIRELRALEIISQTVRM